MKVELPFPQVEFDLSLGKENILNALRWTYEHHEKFGGYTCNILSWHYFLEPIENVETLVESMVKSISDSLSTTPPLELATRQLGVDGWVAETVMNKGTTDEDELWESNAEFWDNPQLSGGWTPVTYRAAFIQHLINSLEGQK